MSYSRPYQEVKPNLSSLRVLCWKGYKGDQEHLEVISLLGLGRRGREALPFGAGGLKEPKEYRMKFKIYRSQQELL